MKQFLLGLGFIAIFGAALQAFGEQSPIYPYTSPLQSNKNVAGKNNFNSVRDDANTDIQAMRNAQQSMNTEMYGHASSTSNPHSVTKAQVELGNVDNTSDANKPVSTATQMELDAKQNRVTGSCDTGQAVQAVAADGTVTCGTAGSGNLPTATEGQTYQADENGQPVAVDLTQIIASAPLSFSGGALTFDGSGYATASHAHTAYQPVLQSGVSIKTVNNESLLGNGNISIDGGSGGLTSTLSSAPYSNVPCTSDGVYNHTLYKCVDDGTGTGYFTEYVATTAYSNAAPVLYGVDVTLSGNAVGEYVTFDNTVYNSTTLDIQKLPGTYSLTATVGSSRAASCTGDVTGSSPNYSVSLTDSNATVLCNFTDVVSYVADDFNRADESPLSGNWSTAPGFSFLNLVSNIVIMPSATEAAVVYENFSFNADQYAEGTYANGPQDGGPCVRISGTTTKNGYMLSVNGATSGRILRYVDGVVSVIKTFTFASTTSSSVWRLEISGETLTVKQDGATITTHTDTGTGLTSGNAGFGGRITAFRFDNFKGGNL